MAQVTPPSVYETKFKLPPRLHLHLTVVRSVPRL
ncbi:uncharacterized protein METZ01_LOCUS327596 [marine metagenome]|uniref:Uncharacterized protein n=1 Tax=marine metagenome TaxID=408172 RepID=A0A382PRX6_9ZZZZ